MEPQLPREATTPVKLTAAHTCRSPFQPACVRPVWTSILLSSQPPVQGQPLSQVSQASGAHAQQGLTEARASSRAHMC